MIEKIKAKIVVVDAGVAGLEATVDRVSDLQDKINEIIDHLNRDYIKPIEITSDEYYEAAKNACGAFTFLSAEDADRAVNRIMRHYKVKTNPPHPEPGTFCKFWDAEYEPDKGSILSHAYGYLEKLDGILYYAEGNSTPWNHCRPYIPGDA